MEKYQLIPIDADHTSRPASRKRASGGWRSTTLMPVRRGILMSLIGALQRDRHQRQHEHGGHVHEEQARSPRPFDQRAGPPDDHDERRRAPGAQAAVAVTVAA